MHTLRTQPTIVAAVAGVPALDSRGQVQATRVIAPFNDSVKNLPLTAPNDYPNLLILRSHRHLLEIRYDIAGVLDGRLCFCGMATQMDLNASLKRPVAECQATPCSGDNSTMCGAVDRLLVYNYSVATRPGPWEPH